MASRWDKLVDKDSRYVVEDYERAAYRVITHQLLSVADPFTRKDYYLVAENLREFQQLFEAFGITLRHNPQYRCVIGQPRHVLNQNRASKAVTLLVLVLADLYHRARFNGEEGDFGEVYVELPELQEAYQGQIGEDFPKSAELNALFDDIERWGIARRWRKDMDEAQPFRVLIQPAIADIVTKEWLHLLDGFNTRGEDTDADAAGAEIDAEGEVGESEDVSA